MTISSQKERARRPHYPRWRASKGWTAPRPPTCSPRSRVNFLDAADRGARRRRPSRRWRGRLITPCRASRPRAIDEGTGEAAVPAFAAVKDNCASSPRRSDNLGGAVLDPAVEARGARAMLGGDPADALATAAPGVRIWSQGPRRGDARGERGPRRRGERRPGPLRGRRAGRRRPRGDARRRRRPRAAMPSGRLAARSPPRCRGEPPLARAGAIAPARFRGAAPRGARAARARDRPRALAGLQRGRRPRTGTPWPTRSARSPRTGPSRRLARWASTTLRERGGRRRRAATCRASRRSLPPETVETLVSRRARCGTAGGTTPRARRSRRARRSGRRPRQTLAAATAHAAKLPGRTRTAPAPRSRHCRSRTPRAPRGRRSAPRSSNAGAAARRSRAAAGSARRGDAAQRPEAAGEAVRAPHARYAEGCPRRRTPRARRARRAASRRRARRPSPSRRWPRAAPR